MKIFLGGMTSWDHEKKKKARDEGMTKEAAVVHIIKTSFVYR
jgi:hypothetical protein